MPIVLNEHNEKGSDCDCVCVIVFMTVCMDVVCTMYVCTMDVFMYVFMYVYMYVCMCMCVNKSMMWLKLLDTHPITSNQANTADF